MTFTIQQQMRRARPYEFIHKRQCRCSLGNDTAILSRIMRSTSFCSIWLFLPLIQSVDHHAITRSSSGGVRLMVMFALPAQISSDFSRRECHIEVTIGDIDILNVWKAQRLRRSVTTLPADFVLSCFSILSRKVFTPAVVGSVSFVLILLLCTRCAITLWCL